MTKFNLFNEPWILVLTPTGEVEEISLRRLLLSCDQYVDFAGENKHQDVALIRTVAALIVTLLYRYDTQGTPAPITEKNEAFKRFEFVWNHNIPESIVNAYISEWGNRFYLIDEEHPFFQVDEGVFKQVEKKGLLDKYSYETTGKKGPCMTNEFSIKSIMGTVLESGNTRSPFSPYRDTDNIALSYAEAARWLIWYVNFASCASKSPGNYNSKMTWASGGALIVPQGKTLKETLLLNSVMLYNNTPYEHIAPIWERKTTQGCEYAPFGENGHPDNLPELYTQQSRKIKLHVKNDRVDGLYITPGDYWNKTDARIEPMFMWSKNDKSFTPKHHKASAPAWKEFIPLISPPDKEETSGCVKWVNELFSKGILDEEQNVPFQIVDITYGSMNSSIDTLIEAGLSVNGTFFNDEVSERMKDSIKKVENVSKAVYNFGADISMSCGADKKAAATAANRIKQEYEEKISPKIFKSLNDELSIKDLDSFIFRYAFDITEQEMENIPLNAFKGHGAHSIGKAESVFRRSLWKIKNIEEKG